MERIKIRTLRVISFGAFILGVTFILYGMSASHTQNPLAILCGGAIYGAVGVYGIINGKRVSDESPDKNEVMS